jgi:chemotaxis protein CheD
MSEQAVMVNMAQLAVSDSPEEVLTALGLGSCVAVCTYDSAARLGGMIHVVLPSSALSRREDGPAKFADLGVPRLLEEMARRGADRTRVRVALAGGASVLTGMNHVDGMDIGARNVAAVTAALNRIGMSPSEADVGGRASRTVRLRVGSGEIAVKTLRQGESVLARLR